jgi:protein TonB
MIATIAHVRPPMQTTRRSKPRATKPIVTTRSSAIPSRAIYKPSSKWTAIIAFAVAVALHIGAVVYVQLKPEESVPISLGADQFAEVSVEIAPSIAPEPVPPPEDEPIETPPPVAAAPTDFVEEKPTPIANRSRTSRPKGPIASPQSGQIGSTSSIGAARAVAIRAPRPVYPYEARRAGITGSGVALLTVNSATGAVTSAVMSQSTGNSILDNSTTSAFSRWRFKPGTVTKVRVPITFTLTGAQF